MRKLFRFIRNHIPDADLGIGIFYRKVRIFGENDIVRISLHAEK